MSGKSEASEYWDVYRTHNRESKAERRASIIATLTAMGLEFDTRSGGVHLIMRTPHGLVDFWPGTTKYSFRNGSGRGHGFDRLCKKLGLEIPQGAE